MGILNVTPDSFFDGGRHAGIDAARARARALVAAGAGIVDIGGRSYSSATPAVDAVVERERVVPVIAALVRDGLPVPISVDTTHADVADAALAAGAHIVNDCSGLADPGLARVVARYDAGLVVMHLRGRLNVRDPHYVYDDPIAEIRAFLRERAALAIDAGVAPQAIIVDPGLEFGKETGTDLTLLARFEEFTDLGFPALVAASRKSFLGCIVERPPSGLLAASLAVAALAVAKGARIVRAHDVAETRDVVRLVAAVAGVEPQLAARG